MAQRSVYKSIAEYERKYGDKYEVGYFTVYDYVQIREKNKDIPSYDERLWHCIEDALTFGYMVGYRRAKREESKKRAQARAQGK